MSTASLSEPPSVQIVMVGDMLMHERVIESGIQIDNKTEVIKGLLPDEEIVYSGQSLLENNAKVKIVQLLNIVY